MRIIQLTPGTGNFHCGSCLRDVALVRELRSRGHDVVLVPLYLPLVTEEGGQPEVPIFFGGINVYLQHKFRLFRSTPRWVDRWLDHPGLLRRATRGDQMTSAHELGELTVSMLRGEEGRQIKELHRLIDWLRGEPPPDIVCLSNVLLVGMAKPIREALGCPVVCTAHGEDGFLDALPQPYRDEAWQELVRQSRHVACFLPVSEYYGRVLQERTGIEKGKFRVVHNGINFDGFVAREELPEPPVIGYLARMSQIKGLGTLVKAFVKMNVPGARLAIAGAMTAGDEAFVAEQKAILERAGCLDRVVFRPNLEREEKIDFLRGLSVLSVPATYGESFGMYVVEALGCGVPVVQPDHAAFPELLEATGGGLLCRPDDPDALAEALTEMVTDRGRNEALGRAGRETVLEQFSVARMAEEVLSLYREVTA